MQRAIATIALTGLCVSASPVAALPAAHYDFFGTELTLSPQTHAIAITWDEVAIAPQSLAQLPDDLQLDLEALGLVLQSVGRTQATLTTTSGAPVPNAVMATLEAHPTIAAVQPVMAMPAALGLASTEDAGATPVIVTHELLVNFDPTLSEAAAAAILQRAGVEVIRPLRFTDSMYLVAAPEVSGLEVLAIAQQLQNMGGVITAEPNFVQAITPSLEAIAAPASTAESATVPVFHTAELERYAWYLDSTPLRGQLQPRTDIQATEAWAISNQGEGVTVAVIDSTLQLNHPDFKGALACPGLASADALAGETCGWDFVGNDPQPDLSPEETDILRFDLQNSFLLSDPQLLQAYPDLAAGLSDLPLQEQAAILRRYLQSRVQSIFHGTWTAGVIAARPQGEVGLRGVAPQAQILPVRVFDLEGHTTAAALIEATGYAAARGVDVINLSLGSLIPSEAFTAHLFTLLDEHPDLVIVASAGNSNLDGVGFPAAIPGVLSVGATNLAGARSPYSQYGGQLDVVAPGGDLSQSALGGILTTGGTWLTVLWEGMPLPEQLWGSGFDPVGTYVQVQGTSFAAPNVAGVVALMKGEAPDLTREQVFHILRETASDEALSLSQADEMHYRLQRSLGMGTVFNIPFVRRSGIYARPDPINAQEYYFGAGLVNALRVVEAVHEGG